MKKFLNHLRISTVLAAVTLAGCATSGDPRDPIEGFNRGVYDFNDGFDAYVLNPVAKGYYAITPAPVDKGISNFFSNLNDVTVAFNDLLQFKFQHAAGDVGRVVINSTIGILGFMDVATRLDLEKHDEDFGQTLATWGVGSGPYLVLPFLGPNTARGTGGLLVDSFVDPINQIDHIPTRTAVTAIKIIDLRADLLALDDIKDVITKGVDPYDVVKDAYLQRRTWLIYDGEPPELDDDEYGDDGYGDEDEAYDNDEQDVNVSTES